MPTGLGVWGLPAINIVEVDNKSISVCAITARVAPFKHTPRGKTVPSSKEEGGLIESDWERFSPCPFFTQRVATCSLTAIQGLVYIVCCWPDLCVCVWVWVWRPNKAEIDAVLGRESFLMLADIQPQKISHWTWKRSKPRTSNWETKRKKRQEKKGDVTTRGKKRNHAHGRFRIRLLW